MGHVKDLKLRAKLSKFALDEKRAEKSRVESEMVRPLPHFSSPKRWVGRILGLWLEAQDR